MECPSRLSWLKNGGKAEIDIDDTDVPLAMDGRGEYTGCARDRVGIGDNADATDPIDSLRSGTPNLNGGGYDNTAVEAFDPKVPMESERNGAALDRWGKDMTDI
mmetsp:Transcript_4215/g.9358  ORF Transcript_4215/g.9358 Transcript_4215/m.9358 type:complete len:104 (-) Transcript_4215:1119-1430(-)